METAALSKCDTESLLEMALSKLDSANYQMAMNDSKAILSTDSENVDASILGGHAAMKLRKFEEAYEILRFGLQADPKNKRIAEELRLLQNAIIEKGESEVIEEIPYCAVSLCSQEIYPGDEELFLCEREILTKKYHIESKQVPMIPVSAQRAKDAAREALVAHGCITSDLSDALRHCNCALNMDDSNAAIRHLRADICYQREEYVEALRDLYRIPKSNRSPASWKMGGLILKYLDLPVSAEFWFRKATEIAGGNEEEEAAILFQTVRVSRLYDPLTTYFPVRVNFTKYGRSIVAKEDLKPGDIAFEDAPVVHAQLLDGPIVNACDHCGYQLMRPKDYFGETLETLDDNLKELVASHWPNSLPVVCDSCDVQKYCSEECKDQAWDTYHQVICPTENHEAKKIYDICENSGYGYNKEGQWVELWNGHFSPMTLVKMWAMIACEARRLMQKDGDGQPTVIHWAKAKMPFRKFIAYGSAKISQTMPDFYEIVQDIFANCGDGIRYSIDENEFNGRYLQAKCNLQTFSGKVTPYHIFMTNLSKCDDANAIGMLKHLHKSPPAPFLAGLFPLHACLNHACDNNVEVTGGSVNGQPGVNVNVRRNIKKGDELFTTYIDTSMPRRLRRVWLYTSFNFWCICLRCRFEGDGPEICSNCNNKSSERKQFPACSKCHRAWYCSVNCQKEAWKKGHKVICQLGHSNVQVPAVSS